MLQSVCQDNYRYIYTVLNVMLQSVCVKIIIYIFIYHLLAGANFQFQSHNFGDQQGFYP